MIGFTFAYGSMFGKRNLSLDNKFQNFLAKVWIVHRMGANENHELASIVKDEVRFLGIFALL
jgi:hypothetical protein